MKKTVVKYFMQLGLAIVFFLYILLMSIGVGFIVFSLHALVLESGQILVMTLLGLFLVLAGTVGAYFTRPDDISYL